MNLELEPDKNVDGKCFRSHQALIERMQQNRVPNYLLTDEEFQCLKDAEPYIEYRFEKLEWTNTTLLGDKNNVCVHRIRDEFKPEPTLKTV